jgi:signal transduction histidine kinase
LAVASAPLLLLAIVTGWIGASSLIDAAQETQTEIGLRVGGAVEKYLENVVFSIETFDRYFDLLDFSEKSIENQLSILIADNEAIQSAFIIANDKRRSVEAYVDRDGLFGQSDKFVSMAQDLLDDISGDDQPAFESLHYNDTNGRPRFLFSYPLIELQTGHVEKVLAIVVRGEELWRILRQTPISKYRDVYVVEVNGLVIAHRDSTTVLQRKTLDNPSSEGIRRGLSGDLVVSASHQADINGASFIVIAEQQLFAALAPALRLIATISAFFVAGIVLAFWLSKRNYKKIVEPIETVSRVAHAVGEGDLTQRTNLEGDDEIIELGKILDGMIDNFQRLMSDERDAQERLNLALEELNQLNFSLEAQVKERTHQLEVALDAERQTNAMQRRFVSMVSHEFRTPLAIIDGQAQRLIKRDDKFTSDRRKASLEKVRNAVRRLTNLMESVLSSASLEAGSIAFAPASMDLRALVQQACAAQQEVSQSHRINADIDALPEIYTGDPKLLFQVMANLLSNAVKYSPDADRVDVSGKSTGEGLEISVRDFGIGIPENELPKISKRFFRASTSSGIQGTGIGLNFVKALIEMHSGTMEISSEVDEGSTFTVKLPHQPAVEGNEAAAA